MLFNSVLCDWLTLRHDYPVDSPGRAFEGGRILKIDADGVIDYEAQIWERIRCPSSDTSIRFKSDGQHLWAMGNIGRFQQSDNFLGLTVVQCVERFSEVLGNIGMDMHMFGTIGRQGQASEWGTKLTRIDLAANMATSDYSALMSSMSVRRIGQKLPILGKYGPTWGYDAKRGNWIKAKLYDKDAELAGRRTVASGPTRARFEVQLGSEYLKRNDLDTVIAWRGDSMENVIFNRFAEQVFKESVSVEDWRHIPSRLRHHAVLWRDGVDIRSQVSQATYYRVRKALLDYGIDIGAPCNVIALTRHVRVVEITPLAGLRTAA